jgi:hypothetical protein
VRPDGRWRSAARLAWDARSRSAVDVARAGG